MKRIFHACMIFFAAILIGFGQIIPPLYVGNIEPILDEYNRPLIGSYAAEQNRSLIEIRIAEDGIIRPPYPDGTIHPKNPLLRSSWAGLNAMGNNSGLFCEIFPQRIDPTNLIFARAYNKPTRKEATFYMDTPTYTPSKIDSSLVMKFGNPKPMDPRDDDGDGLNNSWEENLGIDDRYTADYDGDGMSDLMEMLAGTAPDDPNSFFAIKYINMQNNIVDIGWYSVPNKTYQVQHTTDLIDGFKNVENSITAGPGEYELNKTLTETNRMMHYRVVIP